MMQYMSQEIYMVLQIKAVKEVHESDSVWVSHKFHMCVKITS